MHVDVKGSENANCISLDDTYFLHVDVTDSNKASVGNINNSMEVDVSNDRNDFIAIELLTSNVEKMEIDDYDENETFDEESSTDNQNHKDYYGKNTNKQYIDSVLEFIAGFIVRSVLRRMRCEDCLSLLIDKKGQSEIIKRISRGGLVNASPEVIQVLKLIEKIFRKEYTMTKGIFGYLLGIIKKQIPETMLPIRHTKELLKHRSMLLHKIIYTYLRLRIKHKISLKISPTKRRRILTKLITFRNE